MDELLLIQSLGIVSTVKSPQLKNFGIVSTVGSPQLKNFGIVSTVGSPRLKNLAVSGEKDEEGLGSIINIGSDIVIKDIDGYDKISLGVSESFVHTKELMKENSISIQFNLNTVLDFVRGDFLEYEGEKFILRKNFQPEEISREEYRYELVFEGTDMQFQDFILFYTALGLKEAEWTLTAGARDFMLIVLENIQRYFNDDSFALGDVIDSEIQNISFDADTVFDALASIAETFECDWYLEGKKLNLVSKYEYGEPIVLKREIALADITRSNDNDSEYCTRLYALGSTRNIPRNYRRDASGETAAIVQKRLRLPASNGDYIDALPYMKQSEIIEKVVRFEDIYPRRVGSITELRSVDRTKEETNPFIVYFFKDSGLQFSSEYILPGETLMITFESGWLQGRDFELDYNDESGEFEIINDTGNPELTIPNEVLKPRVGDEYVIYNFDISLVSDQYIPEAEEELLEKATQWLRGITEDNATYECPNNPGYCYQNGIDLDIGQKVELVSPIFMSGSKTSRIYGYTKSLFSRYICTYLVGDTSKYSRLASIEKTVNEAKTLQEVQYREASKSIRALNYLRTAMENETVIDKGIVLTTLLRLGVKAGNEWKERAGVSGIYDEGGEVAFWAGGTLEEAVNNLANMIIRMDGSGQLAKGNIFWDAIGNLTMSGKFESNKNGNKIVIDPANRSIQLIDSDKGLVGNWSFFQTGSIMTIFNKPAANQVEQIQTNGNSISFSIKNTNTGDEYYSRIGTMGMVFDTRSFPDASNLSNLETGTIYKDGNVLKIKM